MKKLWARLKEAFSPETLKVEPRKMPLVYCVDCERNAEATQQMRCANCNSDAVVLVGYKVREPKEIFR